jgi:hypothetical protein
MCGAGMDRLLLLTDILGCALAADKAGNKTCGGSFD